MIVGAMKMTLLIVFLTKRETVNQVNIKLIILYPQTGTILKR